MKTAVLATLCLVASAQARAESPESAWARAQSFQTLLRLGPVSPGVETPPVQGKAPPSAAGEDAAIFRILSDLPQTDARTAAWLAGRIPGLNTGALRTAPSTPVDQVLQRAATQGQTWLDVFSDKDLVRDNQEMFYLSQDVLGQIDRTWVTGSLPIQGTGADGQPFHMQAMVLGRGRLYALYDRSALDYNDGHNDFRITNNGVVSVNAQGPADLGISGVQVHGCKLFFCAWADIQRLTKTAATTVHVHTDKGDQDSDLTLVRRR